MPNLVLSPKSGIEHLLVPGNYGRQSDRPGVIIAPRPDLALAYVMMRKGKAEDLQRQVENCLGIKLPSTAKRAENGNLSLTWAGPGRWLAATSAETPVSLVAKLRDFLPGLVSVIDQSDGLSVFRLSGPRSRDMLAKGVPIDLDPLAFSPGDTAMTLVGHINVHLWQLDTEPTYEFAVFRSLAASLCEWLLHASATFGVFIL